MKVSSPVNSTLKMKIGPRLSSDSDLGPLSRDTPGQRLQAGRPDLRPEAMMTLMTDGLARGNARSSRGLPRRKRA
jgi:hypothetical protein